MRQRARMAGLLVVALAAGACSCSLLATSPAAVAARAQAPSWATGACAADDRTGITVVVDFGDLRSGTASSTVTRCVAASTTSRTGIDVLRAAGFVVTGVERFDAGASVSFVCRIDGRPTSSQPLDVGGSDPYVETCADTPPTNAYWSYWSAPRPGAAWKYSTLGADARFVAAGSAEGWSFSVGAAGAPPTPPERITVPPGAAPDVTPAAPTVVAPAPAAAPAATSGASTSRAPGTRAQPHAASVARAVAPAPATAPAPAPALALAEPVEDDLARAAAAWLAEQVRRDGTVAGPDGDTPDHGLAIDVLFALRATGGDDATAARIDEMLVGDGTGPTRTDADDPPRLAKRLVAAVVAGRNATDVNGVDLRADTASAFRTAPTTGTFGHAFAVIGLARSGGAPRPLVARLLRDQCPSGWYRVDPTTACDATGGDPDSTAMAAQALAAAHHSDPASVPPAAITRAVDQLIAAQQPDGSIGGGIGTTAPNANSTGLTAQALDAGLSVATGARSQRYRRAQDRARSWMTSLVVGPDVDELGGAIAYDRAAFERVIADTDRLELAEGQRDQWRRATAQAIFAFAPVSMHRLGGTPLPVPAQLASSATSSAGRDERRELSTGSLLTVLFAVLAGGGLGGIVLYRYRSIDPRGDE